MTTAIIRMAEAADAPDLARIYAPSVENAATSFEEDPPSPDEMRRRLASILPHAPWLVCTHGDAMLGFAYAARHRERAAYRWSLDATVYIAADAHRRGVGRALYTSLFALARLQGYRAVHAGITLPNPASVGLHEALGFSLIGVYPAVGYKRGAWHDVGWWQLEIAPRAAGASPPEPRSPAIASAHPDWSAAMTAGLGMLRL